MKKISVLGLLLGFLILHGPFQIQQGRLVTPEGVFPLLERVEVKGPEGEDLPLESVSSARIIEIEEGPQGKVKKIIIKAWEI